MSAAASSCCKTSGRKVHMHCAVTLTAVKCQHTGPGLVRDSHTLTYSSRMLGFSRISLYAVPITTHSCPSGRLRMPCTAGRQVMSRGSV